MNELETVVFWGTGKVGKFLSNLYEAHGFKPDYYCDINEEKQSALFDGIEVISPEEINELYNVTLVATLFCSYEVKKYIYDNEIKVNRYIDGSNYSSYEFLRYIYEKKQMGCIDKSLYNKNKCIMDFNYGTWLGGVETWCYNQSSIMNTNGVESLFLMPDNQKNECDYPDRVASVSSNEYSEYDKYVDSYINYLKGTDAKYIIVNYPREILTAAVLVKTLFRPELSIIVVIHNDEEIYYDTYNYFKDYIDKWCVISDIIEGRVKRLGIENNKIFRVNWKVRIDNTDRLSSFLRIGYAGRIVKGQKRIDRILDVAEALKKNNIDCSFQIAGTGDAEEYLKERLASSKYLDNVEYLGYVSHDKIADFWSNQDIFLSCSDYEGHSLSQYEAMAAGAVPVVTDTSGVRDDVTDGENGFILPIGDVEGIVEKIIYLDKNRDVLQSMSDACIDLIEKRNSEIDEEAMWKSILDLDQ